MNYNTRYLFCVGLATLLGSAVCAGQVSVINPSGVGGTIGTILPTISLPPALIDAPTSIEVSQQPDLPAISSTTPDITVNAQAAEVSNTSGTNLQQSGANTDLTSSTTSTVQAATVEPTSIRGILNSFTTSIAGNSRSGNTKARTVNVPSTIDVASTVTSNFSPAEISKAVTFIEQALSSDTLTQNARASLLAELKRLNALK